MTLARMTRINKVPDTTTLPGLREMQVKDISKVSQLFSLYIKRFGMAPVFSETEVKHQLLSGCGRGEVGSGGPGRREGQVTWSYVVEVRTLLPVSLSDRCEPIWPVLTTSGSENEKYHRLLFILLLAFNCDK